MGGQSASEPKELLNDVARVVIPRDEIAARVGQLAGEIAECYAGRELTILAVLTGSLIFLSDLIRRLPLRMRVDVVAVSSYPGPTTCSQGADVRTPVPPDLAGRDVLILDDILDSGRTLAATLSDVRAAGAASVRSCVLLRKRRPDVPSRTEADFVGFEIENEFVVGYGLDFDRLYRNLPDVCLLKDRAGGDSR